jgi:benzodiazapine receptor
MHIPSGKMQGGRAVAGREAFQVEAPRGPGPSSQLALGLALAGGAILASVLMGRRHEQLIDDEEYAVGFAEMHEPVAHQPKALTSLILPPLFLAMTLSGLRIWNAPSSPTRTRALTLWSLVQGFNALWLALGAKRVGGQLGAATASIAVSAAYAVQAHKLAAPGSTFPGPLLGWLGFANALSDSLWKRPTRPTVH